MRRVAFVFSGLPGSGSTTGGKNLARLLDLGEPYYSGGAARCLAQKREEIGEEILCQMYRDENGGREKLEAMIAGMMVAGEIPARPLLDQEYATFPPEFDFVLDGVQRRLLEEEQAAVHEGRMAPHLVKQIKDLGRAADKVFIRIFFVADEEERVRRLNGRDEFKDQAPEFIRERTAKRLATERARYRELYGIENHVASEHFDIILDTTHFSKEETLQELLRRIEGLHPGLLAQFIPEK